MSLTLVFPDHTVAIQELFYSLGIIILLPRIRPAAAAILSSLALVFTTSVVFYSNPSLEQTLVRLQVGSILVLFLTRRLFAKEGSSESEDGALRRYLLSLRFVFALLVVVYFASLAFKNQDVFRAVSSVWFLLVFIWGLSRQPGAIRIPWKAVAVNGAVLMVSLGISLGMIELGVRAFVKVLRPPGVFAPHGKYIFTLQRNARGFLRARLNSSQIQSFPLSISSQGLRDRYYGPKKADEFRILIIGDSFAFGHALRQADTIGRCLQALMATETTAKTITVMNGGVGGYAPWQARGFLQERGFSLSPDLVVFQLFPSNDIDGSLERYGRYLQSYDPMWKKRIRNFRSRMIFRFRLHRFLLIHVHTYAFFYDRSAGDFSVVDLIDSTVFSKEEIEDAEPPPLADRNFLLEPSLAVSYPNLEEAWSLFEKTIVSAAEDCRKRKVDFLGFVIPAQPEVNSRIWNRLVHRTKGKVVYDRWKTPRKTREIFERNGLAYVSTAEKFREYLQAKDLYWKLDGHLNPSGALFVAETLRDYLVNEYFAQAD